MKEFREFNELLTEGGLARIWQHTMTRNVGTITAFRGENTKQENLSLNAQLQADIRSAGYGFYTGEGKFTENLGTDNEQPVYENVFIVIGDIGDDSGKLKGFLKKMGQKYNQDSVIFKPFDSESAVIIGTKTGVWPGLGTEAEVGDWKPNLMTQFYTYLRFGRARGWSFTTTPKNGMTIESVEPGAGFFGSYSKYVKSLNG